MSHRTSSILFSLFMVGVRVSLQADGPADNLADKVRPVPPAGMSVPDADRRLLTETTKALGDRLQQFRQQRTNSFNRYLADVEIFHKAVDWALRFDEFYQPQEIKGAYDLLRQGNERLDALSKGQVPWIQQTGLVVRGYRSKIDGSVQPYGLVVPAQWQSSSIGPFRLDAWFHGRGEKLTELSFLLDRQRNPGEFVPAGAFVLHPYGRYCNANKFAGEVDLFEALDHLKLDYPIDENRLVMRGFSMGGAACWQFAVHYPGLWAAAAPGAGFSETPDFLKVFQQETLTPTAWEKALWHQYDCTDYALNLFNVPTVAYSGEKDRQKQAADVMVAAAAREKISLVHLVGPGTEHRYHPETKKQIDERINALARLGREPVPRRVQFTTWTLRYPECDWIRLEGLANHWQQARVTGEIMEDQGLVIKTKNVTRLELRFRTGQSPFPMNHLPWIEIDGKKLAGALVQSDLSWKTWLEKKGAGWKVVDSFHDSLAKRPGLQGPIDDAFFDSFLVVKPSSAAKHPAVHQWVSAEMPRSLREWRKQFRGDAQVKMDSEITEQDLAANHLVLWGDPQSNVLLAKILPLLPIRWNEESLVLGDKSYSATDHLPILIFPNPLNPKKYVVINSGITFREYDYLNNARQVSKLPDYAVVDLNTPPNSRAPGRIVRAGFFNEEWKF